jgi:hypothetical protein
MTLISTLIKWPLSLFLPGVLHQTIYPIWKLWGTYVKPGPSGMFSTASNLAWAWMIAAIVLATMEWQVREQPRREDWVTADILLGTLGIVAYFVYTYALA